MEDQEDLLAFILFSGTQSLQRNHAAAGLLTQVLEPPDVYFCTGGSLSLQPYNLQDSEDCVWRPGF